MDQPAARRAGERKGATLIYAGRCLKVIDKFRLASDFVKRKELPAIFKAQQDRGLVVFWIPIAAAAYKAVPQLAMFQAALDAGRPLMGRTGENRNKAWVEITDKLMEAAGITLGVQPAIPRIVLLHRQGTQPDEQVLDLLDEGLTKAGYQVFTYQRISMEELNQLNSKLTRAEAVIPLISKKSESSEIVEMHVETARQQAEKQGGHPRLIPVLVQYNECSANTTLGRCAELAHVRWNGPEDNSTLCDRVLQVLRSPAAESTLALVRKTAIAGPPIEGAQTPAPVTGAAAQDRFYIVRATDTQLERHVLAWEPLIRIKGSRQMGKTTLLSHAVRCARQNGAKVALTDYQSLHPTQLSTVENLYKTIAESIVDSLDLDIEAVEQNWRPNKPPNWNLERVMKKSILPSVDGHLVWAMDEVERVFQHDYAPEFFRLVRSWCSLLRTQSPIFERLTVVMAYATEAHLFLPDPNESPFNLGKELLLSDFDFEQTAELNARAGSPVKDRESLRRLYDLLGGQPFLTREALDWVRPSGKLPLLLIKADTEGGPFGDHLRWLYAMLAQHSALARAVRAFLREEQPLSEDEFFRLRAAGVFAGDSANTARIRCGLYERYLRKRFVEVPMRQGA